MSGRARRESGPRRRRQTKAVMPPHDPVLASFVSSAGRPLAAFRAPISSLRILSILPILCGGRGGAGAVAAGSRRRRWRDGGAAFTAGPDRRPRRQLPPSTSSLSLSRALCSARPPDSATLPSTSAAVSAG
uniref:Uncharacterized protein n=1 Tax=Plectus sambesii TaxID=2011161 RepID=A0A914VWK9_9BILA